MDQNESMYIYVFFHFPPMLFIKKACNKMNDQTDIEESDEKKPSFEDEDSIFSNGKCNLVIPLSSECSGEHREARQVQVETALW